MAMTQNLAIELDDSVRGYGTVHRAGCRDLRDPELLGEWSTVAEVAAAIEDATGWERTAEEVVLAPCVKLPRK
jgi:hypothetical protein